VGRRAEPAILLQLAIERLVTPIGIVGTDDGDIQGNAARGDLQRLEKYEMPFCWVSAPTKITLSGPPARTFTSLWTIGAGAP